jgi:seryl-tRNA synthetase
MLDIKFIRENIDLVKSGAEKKHIDVDIARLIEIDDKRKELLSSVEKKRAEQNLASEQIAAIKNDEMRAHEIAKMKILKDVMQKEEEDLKEVMKEWRYLMIKVPNIPDMSVPEGKNDEDNKEIRVWGQKPKFLFEPKNHIKLMEGLDMADFERGAKVSGFRGYFLKNDGARLSAAVWMFVENWFSEQGGFTQMLAPSLVNRESFLGTGFIPQSEDDLYKTQDENYLSGTAEVAMMGYYMDETLSQKDLPLKFLAFSPCFRREAGSHGKDTKGLLRVHEFFKFEQVILCEASHEESVKHHEAITENSEKIMQVLGIPHRVVINCGGDLGLGQVKKYDIESWVPSEKKYRETHSSSYFHDFQARRLNIRYRDEDGKMRFVHSLNNTAIATPRILISLIENNQQEDGSVLIPEALQKYMNKDRIKKSKD